jgi:hypothetical protein
MRARAVVALQLPRAASAGASVAVCRVLGRVASVLVRAWPRGGLTRHFCCAASLACPHEMELNPRCKELLTHPQLLTAGPCVASDFSHSQQLEEEFRAAIQARQVLRTLNLSQALSRVSDSLSSNVRHPAAGRPRYCAGCQGRPGACREGHHCCSGRHACACATGHGHQDHAAGSFYARHCVPRQQRYESLRVTGRKETGCKLQDLGRGHDAAFVDRCSSHWRTAGCPGCCGGCGQLLE